MVGVPAGAPPDATRLAAMVDAWERASGAHPRGRTDAANWPDVLAEMAAARDRVIAGDTWIAGPSTLMGVLDLVRGEVQNCRVLRWLLDPLARHGIGALLLADLANHLRASLPDPALARATVEVSRATSRADTVIEGRSGGRVIVLGYRTGRPPAPSPST